MKVVFLLPGSAHAPIGGFKVIYEYANGLARAGHGITVVSPAVLDLKAPISLRARGLLRYAQRSLDKSFRPDGWFARDPRVQVKFVPTLAEHNIPDADAIVASAWQTAEIAAGYSARKGRKLFLIHDYEHYKVAPPEVRRRIAATFHAGFYNIVTSPAGEEMLAECGAKVDAVIPNAIDLALYKVSVSIDAAERDLLGFPYRHEPFKGTGDAIAALVIVRERFRDIKIWTFGPLRGGQPPPGWITHHKDISDEQLAAMYNRTKIFVTPSHYEGWGLPGSEAMACGAALVTTDSIGVRAYAKDGVNALFSPPRSPESLARNIMELLAQDDLRVKLATSAAESMRAFSWERSVERLIALVRGTEAVSPAKAMR